ncbi:MAG: hypothetical protein AB1497_00690 [Bacillota bacterium]
MKQTSRWVLWSLLVAMIITAYSLARPPAAPAVSATTTEYIPPRPHDEKVLEEITPIAILVASAAYQTFASDKPAASAMQYLNDDVLSWVEEMITSPYRDAFLDAMAGHPITRQLVDEVLNDRQKLAIAQELYDMTSVQQVIADFSRLPGFRPAVRQVLDAHPALMEAYTAVARH